MATADYVSVERIYMNVAGAIATALNEGDVSRAKMMAERAADGKPKVIPKLETEVDKK